MGEQKEVAEHDDNQRIAPAARLERFSGHQQDEQRDAGVAAKERAVVQGDAHDTGEHHP